MRTIVVRLYVSVLELQTLIRVEGVFNA